MTPFPRSWRALFLALPVLSLAPASPVAAQARAFQLTSDNDAYDFWIPIAVRPDYEYSNGLRLAVETEGAGGWKGLARAVAPCVSDRARADAEAGCATFTVEVGQRLYGPRWDTWEPMPGQRPYAG
ncbi:MAG TPA: lipid A-modifier LpxR family protein, partial [Longimicrobium sp.]|nr:lipid A-modifier LpxR family protein [Longimicrobium sp.]